MSSQAQILNLRHFRSGGYGELFVGQLSSNGARVAVKYLREYKDGHARQTFLREVQILRRNLRGLVPLLSWNTEAERPYYVMPYQAGGALSRYAGRLDQTQLHAVALDLACTLANFHATVGTHGDFKPANILVSDDGQLKVADPSGNGLGCTMFLPQNAAGTPGYWAPEVNAKGISRAGDVYSYGATLYEMLSGQRPRDGQRLDPTSERYGAAPKVREVIVCCCQSDPKARPTMEEVVRILQGEQWADIQAAQKRGEEFLTALGVIGGIALVVKAFLG
jgi:eukaryotic-like serine/threonine-protein kinase